MATRTITLIVDEDDYRDINRAIAEWQVHPGVSHLPEGESDTAGAIVGELVRELWDLRAVVSSRGAR